MALLTVINFSHAQNLVPNPDFETVSSAFCGIASAGDFDNSFDQWISASNSTPDPYFNNINQSCFNFQPNSTYSGPIGIKGSQLPRSGNAMAGGYMYTISMLQQRDYIQVPLTSPLTIGGLYLVEFYVSLADSTEFATSNIGGILSTSAIFQPGDGVYIASPQIEATSVISDDQSWTRIIDTITATDAFAHLTIGNFYDDNSTTLVAHPTNSGAPGTYGSYYFIDDIRVERVYLVDLGYTVTSKGPYNLIAYKKLSMPFMSFFGFCRPKLDVSILANEDSKLTVEITFNYTSGYMSTFNDRGRAKRHVNAIIAKMPI